MYESDIIVVVGRRGSGKSTLVKAYILPQLPRFILLDPVGEYDIPGVSEAHNYQDFLDLLEIGENIRIVGTGFIADKSFGDIVKMLSALELKYLQNYYLVIDEFHAVYENWARFQADVPDFKRLLLMSRHLKFGFVIITQRPKDIPPYVWSQVSYLYAYNVYHENDIHALKDCLNEPEKLRDLGEYEFYEITFAGQVEAQKKILKI